MHAKFMRLFLAVWMATALGCEARRLTLAELEYPIVLNSNPFIGLAQPPSGTPSGNYAGECAERIVDNGFVTELTTINSSQLNAVVALQGQTNRAIRKLGYDVEEVYALFYIYSGVRAAGEVTRFEIEPRGEE